jgi:hypothetical protein
MGLVQNDEVPVLGPEQIGRPIMTPHDVLVHSEMEKLVS